VNAVEQSSHSDRLCPIHVAPEALQDAGDALGAPSCLRRRLYEDVPQLRVRDSFSDRRQGITDQNLGAMEIRESGGVHIG